MNQAAAATFSIQSTAGAVPVKNDKGELSMQKVKVHRYVSGKRPDYAPMSSSEEESEEEDFIEHQQQPVPSSRPARPPPRHAASPTEVRETESDFDDPRLRRLKHREVTHDEEDNDSDIEVRRERRSRRVPEPEILDASEPEDVDMDIEETETRRGVRIEADGSQSEDEEELTEEEIERRRQALRQKLLARREEQEPEEMIKEEDQQSVEESEDESSEYEEEMDSEEETGPRLKPVFVRKKDRITVLEKEREAMKEKQAEIEAKKMAEERKKQTLRMVEEMVRKEAAVKEGDEPKLGDVNTDDENDEVEYEAWKLRELKRIKRDREEREALERERLELERLRNMTEEERRLELRNNPKHVTNRSAKGKYKFLQKYYHRGAFYLNEDDDLYKRDFSAATLEDHFDKTILPKVMQVKNFGRSGRTKYTHLVDQDTTQFESPWVSENAQNLKFYSNQAAGMKQQFEKPSLKKKRDQHSN